jgi:hypothetical protein
LRVGLDSLGSGRITPREENDVSVWSSIPGFAKVIIFLQTLIILFMSFWIYQEYLNNSYLQSYVNGYLQGGLLTAIILISIGSFTIIAFALYAKLRSTRKELEGMHSTETVGPDGRQRGQSLDTRTEQHLIEMIRKTTPIMNSGSRTGGQMPTLRRVDSQSKTEEQGSSQ